MGIDALDEYALINAFNRALISHQKAHGLPLFSEAAGLSASRQSSAPSTPPASTGTHSTAQPQQGSATLRTGEGHTSHAAPSKSNAPVLKQSFITEGAEGSRPAARNAGATSNTGTAADAVGASTRGAGANSAMQQPGAPAAGTSHAAAGAAKGATAAAAAGATTGRQPQSGPQLPAARHGPQVNYHPAQTRTADGNTHNSISGVNSKLKTPASAQSGAHVAAANLTAARRVHLSGGSHPRPTASPPEVQQPSRPASHTPHRQSAAPAASNAASSSKENSQKAVPPPPPPAPPPLPPWHMYQLSGFGHQPDVYVHSGYGPFGQGHAPCACAGCCIYACGHVGCSQSTASAYPHVGPLSYSSHYDPYGSGAFGYAVDRQPWGQPTRFQAQSSTHGADALAYPMQQAPVQAPHMSQWPQCSCWYCTWSG